MFKGGKNIEAGGSFGGFMEDGMGVFEIVIEGRRGNDGEMVSVEDEGGHQGHVFVDDAFGKGEMVF